MDDFRLAAALFLFGSAIAGAWRFVARRLEADWADRAADVALLVFFVQYLAIVLPGLAGLLNPLSIALTTLALSAILFFAPTRKPLPAPFSASPSQNPLKKTARDQRSARVAPPTGDRASHSVSLSRALASELRSAPKPICPLDRAIVVACVLFAAGFLLVMLLNQLSFPLLANDALTYHFPAAAQWLQTGHLRLHETWFFNPANTYSPLAGSTFIAWWLAPIGNPILAKSVQIPALALIFFATLRLARSLGVRAGPSALISLALILTQPFARQSGASPKDDLYLAGFLAAAFAALSPTLLKSRFAPARLGIAIGLALATKYTALLFLPILLLAIDAPFRAGWKMRDYLITLAITLLIAGPWYLRNLLLTGNPFYPIDLPGLGKGLFTPAPSTALTGPSSLFHLLTTGEQGLPTLPLIVLIAGLVASFIAAFFWRAAVLRSPRIRLCMIGPIAAALLFYFTSPYAEARFIYPVFILLAGAWAISTAAFAPTPLAQYIAAAMLLLPCLITGVPLLALGLFSLTGIVAVAVGLTCRAFYLRFPAARSNFLLYGGAALIISIVPLTYLNWDAQITSLEAFTPEAQLIDYGPRALLWRYINEKLPPDQPLAYTNTHYTFPLMGFNYTRPIFYIPTGHNITRLHDLPHLADHPLPGEQIAPLTAAATFAHPDPDQWLTRLKTSGVTHIAVFEDLLPNPPERTIIQQHPEIFAPLFTNPAGNIYQITFPR